MCVNDRCCKIKRVSGKVNIHFDTFKQVSGIYTNTYNFKRVN